MKQKTCPSCNVTQNWDEIHGFENPMCSEFCTFKFTEILPLNIKKPGDCWIDVDEIMPDDFKDVLYAAVYPNGKRDIMTGHREYGLWTNGTQTISKTIAVTHWMPLPDYPCI